MHPSSSQKPEDDLGKIGQSPTLSTSPPPGTQQSKKQNWLISWLKNEVKAFNPGLLIMGIKSLPGACTTDSLGVLCLQLYSLQCLKMQSSRIILELLAT